MDISDYITLIKENRYIIAIFFAIAALALAINSILPGSSSKPTPAPEAGVTTLWADVPPVPNSISDMAINLFFNQSPSDMMSMDYYTDKKPEDVAAFYTDKFMKEFGWEPQPYNLVNRFSVGHGEGAQTPYGQTNGGCEMFLFHEKPAASCTFSKADEQGRHIELSIFASVDEKKSHASMPFSINYVRTTTEPSK